MLSLLSDDKPSGRNLVRLRNLNRMENSASSGNYSHRFAIKKAAQAQWRPFNRDRPSSMPKPSKSRRQLFRERSKDQNDSFTQQSTLRNGRRENVYFRSIEDRSSISVANSDWQLWLQFFHLELKREIDTIGIDGSVNMVRNRKGFSRTFFYDANGIRTNLDQIMTNGGQSQEVDIEYKLEPVIESISIRNYQEDGKCTVYTRKMSKSNVSPADSDQYTSLAKTLDDSSSMGYASRTDATASTSNGSSVPTTENTFIPIGSSTLSTDATDSVKMNAELTDMENSHSSIYAECEASSMNDTDAIDDCHKM